MQSRLGLVAFAGVGILIGCGASGSGSSGFDDPGLCDGGDCADTGTGGHNTTGSFEAGPPPAPSCGDGICSNDVESCRTCPRDCGECPACNLAPSCSNALGIPTNPTPRADLSSGVDEPKADGGTDAGPPST